MIYEFRLKNDLVQSIILNKKIGLLAFFIILIRIRQNVRHKSKNMRYALLKDSFACFSCLLPGHTMNVCDHKVKCLHGCGKFHHDNVASNSVNHIDASEKSGQSCIFSMRVTIGYGPN